MGKGYDETCIVKSELLEQDPNDFKSSDVY